MADEKAADDLEAFNDAVSFVEGITGDKYPGDLWEYLKDGQVLCKLVNTIKPGLVKKVNKPGMPFKEMENITMYMNACKSLGVGGNTFRPPDLYEKRVSYPKAIVLNILALERCTKKIRKGSPPKKTYAYQSSGGSKSPAASPPKAATESKSTAYSFNVSSSTFSNDEPAAPTPTRTAAHSPSKQPGGAQSRSEVEKQRARGAASSQVKGQPDWVKAAKSQQEQNDMIAAKTWMEAVTGEPFIDDDLWETTKSGVYLCKMINKIKPGTVKKYSKMGSKLPFKCMENINMYIEGCLALGMRSGTTFRSPDLYEKRVSYPKSIINNIHALARIAEDIPGYKGPKLEVEIAKGHSY